MIKFEKLPTTYIRNDINYTLNDFNKLKVVRLNLTNKWSKTIQLMDGHAEIPKIRSDGKYNIVFLYDIKDFNILCPNDKWTLRFDEKFDKNTIITDNGINFYTFTAKYE